MMGLYHFQIALIIHNHNGFNFVINLDLDSELSYNNKKGSMHVCWIKLETFSDFQIPLGLQLECLIIPILAEFIIKLRLAFYINSNVEVLISDLKSSFALKNIDYQHLIMPVLG